MFEPTRLLQTLTDALSLGSLYALIAIGYTMVYGVLRLINFAHGEIFMIAMYIVFYGISLFTLPWYVTFTATILVTALLGTLAERLAYRPLRAAPRISVLVSAIGVSYFLQNLATVIFGGRPLNFPQIPLFTDVLVIGDVYIQRLSLIVPVVTAVLLLLPLMPLAWLSFTSMFTSYPAIQKFIINPFYEQQGLKNPEIPDYDDDDVEVLFEDRGGVEAPLKIKKQDKGGKVIK